MRSNRNMKRSASKMGIRGYIGLKRTVVQITVQILVSAHAQLQQAAGLLFSASNTLQHFLQKPSPESFAGRSGAMLWRRLEEDAFPNKVTNSATP